MLWSTKIDINYFSEEESLDLLGALAERWGWAYNVYTREDANDMWQILADKDFDEQMTDAEWEKIKTSDSWRSLYWPMSEELADGVRDAVTEIL